MNVKEVNLFEVVDDRIIVIVGLIKDIPVIKKKI